MCRGDVRLGERRKKAAEIVSGPSGKKYLPNEIVALPRMLLQAWRRVEPKWSRNVSSAERNNCDVTATPQVPVLFSSGVQKKRPRTGVSAGTVSMQMMPRHHRDYPLLKRDM